MGGYGVEDSFKICCIGGYGVEDSFKIYCMGKYGVEDFTFWFILKFIANYLHNRQLAPPS